MATFNEQETIKYEGKDLETFYANYVNVLRRIDILGLKLLDEVKYYGFISRVSLYFQTQAEIKRDQLRNIQGDKLSEKLPLLETLIKGLLDENHKQ